MNWFSHLTHGVGDWLGKEWHNTEKWLPEIGLGAAAIAAPFLAPELLAGGAAFLGGAGEAIGAGVGTIGETIGLGAAEDVGASSAIGAAESAAEGGGGSMATIGAADPWAATVSGEVPEAAWGSAGPTGISPESGLPIEQSAVPTGQAEIDAANANLGTAQWQTEATGVPTSANMGAADPGQSVIQDTFGPNYQPPSMANAESNVVQGNSVGATTAQGASSGGGIMSNLFGSNSMLGGISNTDLLKYGIPAAYLGYTMLRGKNEMPPQANQAQGIAQNEAQVGAEQLAFAQHGEITPPMQANIDIYRQNAINQLRQQYASSGQDWKNSTGYLQGVQQIEQQADAMKQKYIQMEFDIGLRASGQATAAMMQVAQMQFQQDKQFQDAIGNAMKMLGMAAAGGGTVIKLG